MLVRGIRGATTVTENDREEILHATAELLHQIIEDNELDPEMVASIWITVTEDLNAVFPAVAVRSLPGWELVPIMCSTEMPVPGSLPFCVRFMIHVNTEKGQAEIQHVYLNEAAKLRPDLAKKQK
ncbi:chorismate mutase [Paenibacillus sp. 1001270B_150601_E10]|uniref:chorismate mutase n=1 Tax=Paenibacillus sp. 1001270B_150601_E10 TaxID=2787079 RepID=UPI0018A0639B|nr:chorismate mutase [Paenibacillus sp. 1001270B_150601_E10]